MMAVLLLLFFDQASMAQSTKVYHVCDNQVATVGVSQKGTVLDFPAEPEKVILGTKGTYFIEFVKNDLVLSPKANNARSNLFVYLFGRRYVFDLITQSQGATVAVIKDCLEPKKKTSK
jgi:hypothetical protein